MLRELLECSRHLTVTHVCGYVRLACAKSSEANWTSLVLTLFGVSTALFSPTDYWCGLCSVTHLSCTSCNRWRIGLSMKIYVLVGGGWADSNLIRCPNVKPL